MQKLQCSAAVTVYLGTVYDPSTIQGTWFGAIARHRSELLSIPYCRIHDFQASSQPRPMKQASKYAADSRLTRVQHSQRIARRPASFTITIQRQCSMKELPFWKLTFAGRWIKSYLGVTKMVVKIVRFSPCMG